MKKDQFENHFSEAILQRGLKLFTSGKVMFESGENGNFYFKVKGSQKNEYKVQLGFDGDTCKRASCECYYNLEGLCKHIAGAFFYLNQDELGISVKAKNKSASPRQTKEEKALDLLRSANPDQIAQFLQDHVLSDTHLRNLFIAQFTPTSKQSSIKSQIRSMVSSHRRKGYISYSAARTVAEQLGLWQRRMIEDERNRNPSCIEIAWSALEVLVPYLSYMDDSSGSTSHILHSAQEVLSNAAYENWIEESERKKIWKTAFKHYNKETFKGWDEHNLMLELLGEAAQTKSEIGKSLEIARENFSIADQFEKASAYEILARLLNKSNSFHELSLLKKEVSKEPFMIKNKIEACSKEKKWEEVLELMEELKNHHPDKYKAQDFFEAASNIKPLEELEPVLEQWYQSVYDPDSYYRISSLIHNTYPKMNREDLFSFLLPITRKSTPYFTYIPLAEIGNWDEVRREIKSPEFRGQITALPKELVLEFYALEPEWLKEQAATILIQQLSGHSDRNKHRQCALRLAVYCEKGVPEVASFASKKAIEQFPSRTSLIDELKKQGFRLGFEVV